MNDQNRSKEDLIRQRNKSRREPMSMGDPAAGPGACEKKTRPTDDSGGSSKIDSLLAAIADRLFESKPEEFDDWIRETLKTVGEFTAARRFFIFIFHDRSRSVIDETFEWCIEGADPKVHRLRGVDIVGFPWIAQKLADLETLKIPEVSSLPPEAATEKDLAKAMEMHSAVFLPLARGDIVQGIMGLAADTKLIIESGETLTLLHAVGKIISFVLEHRREKENMSRTNAQLRTLFASAPISLFLIDHHRRIHRSNRAGRTFCGLNEEEIAGRRLGEAVHCVNNMEGKNECESTPACERCVIRRAFIDIFETRREIHGLETDITVRGNRGNEVRTVRLNASHFYEGEEPRIVVGLEDITEQKRAEKKIREQQFLLVKVFENIKEGVGIIDVEEKLVFCNPSFATLFDESIDSIMGKSIFELFDEETHEVIISQLEKRRRGETSTYELSFTTKGGNRKHIRLTASPRFDEENTYIGSFGIVWDITDKKRAEEKLLNRQIMERKLLEERTAELKALNHSLKREKAERKRLEERLADILSRTGSGGRENI